MATGDVGGAESALAKAIVAALGAKTARVGVKVPPFWAEKPAVWFAQLEAQFALANITTDQTKFYGNLEPHIAEHIDDVIQNPPESNKYEKLKTELIKRLSVSQPKKVQALLSHEQLGDRKPSTFLHHLKDLTGPDVTNEFIRNVWTNCLPVNIQPLVISQSSMTLEDLADLADRVFEIVPMNPVGLVASTSAAGSELEVMHSELAEVTRKLDRLAVQKESRKSNRSTNSWKSHSRSKSRSKARSRPYRTEGGRRLCWYHCTFKEKAQHCSSPCDFSSETVANDSKRLLQYFQPSVCHRPLFQA
ncbi:uncharacterized protein LOC113226131 [Hyposmocoma kahamanoa]|uniref:uncharacterized protein LOC113226131 n=1 Tax=Hyposmocoma kahamanoa TaxID=1477025 RepID=UPI000E6D5DFF|nr:uncharacterized protein LOC113226131 [Hyposmocoma kahamanoa]